MTESEDQTKKRIEEDLEKALKRLNEIIEEREFERRKPGPFPIDDWAQMDSYRYYNSLK